MMYLIKKLTCFFIFCFLANSFAQSVKVLDKTTNAPISGVAVFNKSQAKTAITDVDGLVDLDSFSNKEVIFFQHISFNLKTIKKSNITNNTVYLEGNEKSLKVLLLLVQSRLVLITLKLVQIY